MKSVPRSFIPSFHYHQEFASQHPGSKSRDTPRRQKPWLAERGTMEQDRAGHRAAESLGGAGRKEWPRECRTGRNRWEMRG